MKTPSLLALGLCATLALFFPSCTDTSPSEQTESETQVSKADANIILSYTNKVVGFLNSVDDETEKYANAVNRFVEAKNRGSIVILSPNTPTIWTLERKYNEITSVPEVIGKSQKELQIKINDTWKELQALEASGKQLDIYIKAENFKDDNYAKADVLLVEIDSIMSNIHLKCSALTNMVDPIATIADNKLMEEHPYGEHIIACKSALKATEKVAIYLQSYEIGMGTATLEEHYNSIATAVANGKSKDASSLKEYYKDAAYQRFFENSIESGFLTALRKLIRAVDAQDKHLLHNPSSSINNVIDAYGRVVSAYNTFIQK